MKLRSLGAAADGRYPISASTGAGLPPAPLRSRPAAAPPSHHQGRGRLGGEEAIRRCRKPEITADAAHVRDSRACTGNFFILAAEGVADLDQYAVAPGEELLPEFFL